jgi:hypothetical protein
MAPEPITYSGIEPEEVELQDSAESHAQRGEWSEAASVWRALLRLSPESVFARSGLLAALVHSGDLSEAVALCRTAFADSEWDRWLTAEMVSALELPNLSYASRVAALLVRAQRGGPWFPDADYPPTVNRFLTAPGLRHDLQQFRYLRATGVMGRELDATIESYQRLVASYESRGDNWRASLSEQDEAEAGRTLGRVVYLDEGARVARALSDAWNRDTVQQTYRDFSSGVVVVDDFLTGDALDALERFCLRSTIWFGNRYLHGRLGAYFYGGFNCPLLLQIAEEIRRALPDIIGFQHPLRHVWAFKNTGELPGDSSVHADFAAVNVNFWITPEAANLDPGRGGMRIYELEAPRSWDFSTYNEDITVIRDYIALHRPNQIRIPYRRNRLILFNSDLFHETEAVRFRPDYESHRINVTMLFGDRQQDSIHVAPQEISPGSNWRSQVFRRSRGGR